VNVAAPFLLTSILLPRLIESDQCRVLFTSSLSQGAPDVLEDPQLKSGWSAHRAYAFSKLACAMIAMEMHARYANPPGLTVNTMDPGTVDTKMLRAGWWSGGSPVSTATTSHFLLTQLGSDMSGGYYVGHRESRAMAQVYDENERCKLWEYLTELTGAEWHALPSATS